MSADDQPIGVDLAREADFRLGELGVRPSIRQLEANGASETLEPRVMQVLVVLARRRGEVVSRDDLIEACWGGRVVGDDALNRCISKIRKLGEAHGGFALETIPRVGYRLQTDEVDVGLPPDAPGLVLAAISSAPPPSARLLVSGVIAIVAAAFVVAMLGYLFIRNSRTVEVTAAPLTVGVLRFAMIDAGDETKRLADSIPRAVARMLTEAGVNVVDQARSLSMTDAEKVNAAALLKVRILIDGEVETVGETTRVSVRVDHAESGLTLWSTLTEFGVNEGEGLPERVASVVARTVSWNGAVGELNSDRPNAPQRAQTFLRVIQLSDERGSDRAAMDTAALLVGLAPDEPAGLVQLAIESIDALPEIASPDERRQVLQRARDAVEKARVFGGDRQLGLDVAALVAVRPPYQWGERIATAEGIVHHEPGGGRFLAQEYLRTGRLMDAKQAVAKSLGRDPYGKSALFVDAQTLAALQNVDAAKERIAEAVLIWRKNPVFRQLRFETGLGSGALGDARTELKYKGDGAIVLQQGATRAGLELIIRALDAEASTNDRMRAESSCGAMTARDDVLLSRMCLVAMAKLGRLDAAFLLVGRLYPDIRGRTADAPDDQWLAAPPTAWSPIDLYMPWLAPLRADLRIVPVFERLGLLDYWRASGEWPDFCDSEPASVCAAMKAGAH